MPIPLAFLLLCCGVLLSATLDQGIADQTAQAARLAPLEAPIFSISSGRGRLLLEGITVSAAHESALMQLAGEHFDTSQAQSDFRPGVVLADNWETTSNRLLYALAATDSAQAVMRDHAIEIRGVTSDAEALTARLAFLRKTLLAETAVTTNIIVVDSRASADALCERSFSQLVLEPVSFRLSGADIRTSSYATLDRITDFAHDCQRAKVAIIGHTDASGDESWNQRLSRARAQAVADHIAGNGIDPARLIIDAFGSSQPVADNATASGRSRNRRIEFELR
jgi:outer membrane protein OmpA-like peptidoglycan-associated protein